MRYRERRVLVTGASGLLGSNIMLLRPPAWTLIALAHTHPITAPTPGVICASVNLLTESVDRALASFLPLDAIIHTAALTNVDRCAREPELAVALNTDLAAAVAQFAQRHGIHLVHISTDHIFDGISGSYTESSIPKPLNVYAQTKHDAEVQIRALGGPHTIVRTNFFGCAMQERQDLAGWMRAQWQSRGTSVRLFSDVRFSPLLVTLLATALFEIVERRVLGVLHVAAADGCTKEAFGRMIADAFHFDARRIESVSVDHAGLAVVRPKDMTLDTRAARALLETTLPTIAQSIEQYRQLLAMGYADAVRAYGSTDVRVASLIA